MDFSSKLLENAVQEIAMLPGIGKRTALRLALHLLKQPKESTEMLSNALSTLRRRSHFLFQLSQSFRPTDLRNLFQSQAQ